MENTDEKVYRNEEKICQFITTNLLPFVLPSVAVLTHFRRRLLRHFSPSPQEFPRVSGSDPSILRSAASPSISEFLLLQNFSASVFLRIVQRPTRGRIWSICASNTAKKFRPASTRSPRTINNSRSTANGTGNTVTL